MQLPILAITFLAVYQFSNRYKTNPKTNASLVVAIPLLVEVTLRIIDPRRSPGLIGWYDVLMATLFFVGYLLVFYKSQQSDTITSWIIWGVAGLAVVPISVVWLASWFRP